MKVFVYGLGNNFTRCIGWIKANYEVIGLVDGAPEKQGKNIAGFEVISPEETCNIDYDAILVTPNQSYEITNRLVELGVQRDDILYLNDVMKINVSEGKLRVVFRLIGGLGDNLINLNYVWYFKNHFGNKVELYLETDEKRSISSELIEGFNCVKEYAICDEDDSSFEAKCDLYIRVIRYPEILFSKMEKIAAICPPLVDYIFVCEKFRLFNLRYFERGIVPDGGSCLHEEIIGKKRIQQPDIDGILGIDENFKCNIEPGESLLKGMSLEAGGFITIHRGCDPKYYSEDGSKLWPIEYYNELISYIKKDYPVLPIVLIGAPHEDTKGKISADIDLVGKTSSKEWMALLKYSQLHIDTEGGNVHLRHALHGGKSIVLFGPTSEKFFGYSENINIRTNACPYPCEWVTLDWSKKCIRENDDFACMKSITPGLVFESVQSLL
ncbi:Glycosyltransferase family 9 (heptosyltransferase) [Pseudobutyrivibrio sp. 49]|uniref:glycosyltransferase family 9 protein n=1 Tax=Pseudobutyrivibrio sp. 49 TaxID=1855344 RepID=UPI00087F8083|nr:glycosyltransferase family 9 protein [Pseudobutyrivibrio sp. 49]SDH92104.1 Glycosyltransferase family 9 (heptosyltransferase) [Pseudobutyrivibrio sp. 49]